MKNDAALRILRCHKPSIRKQYFLEPFPARAASSRGKQQKSPKAFNRPERARPMTFNHLSARRQQRKREARERRIYCCKWFTSWRRAQMKIRKEVEEASRAANAKAFHDSHSSPSHSPCIRFIVGSFLLCNFASPLHISRRGAQHIASARRMQTHTLAHSAVAEHPAFDNFASSIYFH